MRRMCGSLSYEGHGESGDLSFGFQMYLLRHLRKSLSYGYSGNSGKIIFYIADIKMMKETALTGGFIPGSGAVFLYPCPGNENMIRYKKEFKVSVDYRTMGLGRAGDG